MAVKSYYSVSGRILAQRAAGGRTDYLTDALGSVTAIASSSATIQNRYRYRPTGAVLVKSGIEPDPNFLWVGATGVRATKLTLVTSYVRRRHYSSNLQQYVTPSSVGQLGPSIAYVLNQQNLVSASVLGPANLAGVNSQQLEPCDKQITSEVLKQVCVQLKDYLGRVACLECDSALCSCGGNVVIDGTGKAKLEIHATIPFMKNPCSISGAFSCNINAAYHRPERCKKGEDCLKTKQCSFNGRKTARKPASITGTHEGFRWTLSNISLSLVLSGRIYVKLCASVQPACND